MDKIIRFCSAVKNVKKKKKKFCCEKNVKNIHGGVFILVSLQLY